jgi:hypothetical protein
MTDQPRALPDTLAEFLREQCSRFNEPPDADWISDVASIYKTTPQSVRQALQSLMPAASRTSPLAAWRHPGGVAVSPPVRRQISESSHTRGYDAVIGTLRRGGHLLRPHTDPRGRESIRTTCPAHHDTKPSLVVTQDDGKALVRCFAGCRTTNIVAALGLTMADLFVGRREPVAARRVVATYDYQAIDGTILGQKIRYTPKGFRWRHHSPDVGLYRLPSIINSATVYLTEGEKSCDRLWTAGIVATCGPAGASRWISDWSRSLSIAGCSELIIIADNDPAGRDHAERVAAITHALDVDGERIAVKVLILPGLPYAGDVVDWLDAGHDVEELVALVAATPTWSPERLAQERSGHRKMLRQQRNRRYRERLRASRKARPETLRMSEHSIETARMSRETLRRETLPNVLLGTSQDEVSRDAPLSAESSVLSEISASVSLHPDVSLYPGSERTGTPQR